LRNFAFFATVGANNAVVESCNTTVTNGQMAIEFKLVQDPKTNAIEILPLANLPLTTLKFRYADGTPVTGTLNYACLHHCFRLVASCRWSTARRLARSLLRQPCLA